MNNTLLLEEQRKAAAERLAQTKLPSSQHESWRKIRLEQRTDLSPFSVKDAVSSIQVASSSEKSVTVLTLQEALQHSAFQKMIRADLTEALEADDTATDYFQLQNLAQWTQACFIHIHQSPDEPLILKHQRQRGNSVIHRSFIHISAHVQATLIEVFQNDAPNAAACYWNTHTTIQAAEHVKLRALSLRNYSTHDHHFQRIHIEQIADSKIFLGVAHCGGAVGKGFVQARLNGANSKFRGVGICVGNGREFHDMEMLVEHSCSHSDSSLCYKTVLNEQAHSVFDGKLVITPGTRAIQSHQINQNILLNANARAESMPRLVIQAEDVSCEHGATVGMLDDDALFYLQSRGLAAEQARLLLVEGFLQEALHEFPLGHEEFELLANFKVKLGLESSS